MTKELIHIATITKAHGIKGQAKLISYSENPEHVFKYKKLYDEAMQEYNIKKNAKLSDNIFIITFNNNSSRNIVESIAGTKLFIEKEQLPQTDENEYYHHDLIGLEILDLNKKPQGIVIAVHNFGAGDIIEVKSIEDNKTVYLPFAEEYIKEINLEKKYLIFELKPGF